MFFCNYGTYGVPDRSGLKTVLQDGSNYKEASAPRPRLFGPWREDN